MAERDEALALEVGRLVALGADVIEHRLARSVGERAEAREAASFSAKRRAELLEELRDSLEGDSSHSPKASGWFDGVKRFFGDL